MKAIITDLDRTLLHTDKSVSAYTVETLHKCHEQGIRVMAASARPLRDLIEFDKPIGFDAMTATNGAVIQLPEGLVEISIPCESGEKILEALWQHPDVFLSIETSKGLYSNRDIPQWQPVVYEGFPRLPEDVLLYKILVSSPHRQLYETIESMLTPDVYHTIANGELVQIMSREATKWNGVCRMLAAFGLSPEDAVYFGDDNDDVEPLRKCGLGIAMANAIPAALAVADDVAAANDQDGVARYINQKILCKKA